MEQRINPQMIVLGREAQGLTQKDLSNKLSISQGVLSMFERGDRNMSSDILELMAKTLEVPQEFFYYKTDVIPPSLIYYRARSSMSSKLDAKIVATLNIKRIQVNELLKSLEIEKRVKWMEPDKHLKITPEDIARTARAELKLPVRAIKDIVKTLENAGIIIIPINIEDEKFDAVSMITEKGQPIILVNNNMPSDRITFSLAHEFGHIMMHLPFTIEFDRDIEGEANEFAAEFLAPTLDIRQDLRNLTLPRLADLKKTWKLSMAFLIRRALTLKCITDNQYKYLLIQMSTAGYRKREPIELDFPIQKPELFSAMIKSHLDQLNYTAENLSKTILMSLDHLQNEYQTKTIKLNSVS